MVETRRLELSVGNGVGLKGRDEGTERNESGYHKEKEGAKKGWPILLKSVPRLAVWA